MGDIRAYKSHYRIDGKRYDRITSLFDEVQPKSLVQWKLDQGKDEAERQSKEAMVIGSRVDALAQEIMAGKPISVDSEPLEVRNCLEGFRRWLKEEHPKVVDWQVTCKDDGLMLAGTRDIGLEDTIVDVKCSGKINPNYWLQVAMYIWMADKPYAKMGILRLDKMTSDYEYKVIPYSKWYVDTYVGLLNYSRYLKGDNGDND